MGTALISIAIGAVAAAATAAGLLRYRRDPAYQRLRDLRKGMDRAQRRRIGRSVRGGRAVSDPREAALAAEYGELTRALRSHESWITAYELLLITLVAVFAITRQHRSELLALAPPVVVLLGTKRAMSRFWSRRVDASIEKNRELARQFGERQDVADRAA